MLEQKKNAQHATIVLVSAEQPVIMLAEAQSYPLSACISDTGGAAGLFLGLNVIGKIYKKGFEKKPFLENLSCSTFKYLIFIFLNSIIINWLLSRLSARIF